MGVYGHDPNNAHLADLASFGLTQTAPNGSARSSGEVVSQTCVSDGGLFESNRSTALSRRPAVGSTIIRIVITSRA